MRRELARFASLSSLALTMLLSACAGTTSVPSVEPGREYAPTVACGSDIRVPRLIATRAAMLSDGVWDRKLRWESQLRFRIDASGAPYDIRATVPGADSDQLERATAAALAAYRFCRPVDFSTYTEWVARMRFTYSRLSERVGAGEMYTQLFVPAYTRTEVHDGRTGTVKVRGVFGPDGRPTSVSVASSSGDAVLDNKSLDAMASHQLVFRPGTVLTRPFVFEQPYTYEIR